MIISALFALVLCSSPGLALQEAAVPNIEQMSTEGWIRLPLHGLDGKSALALVRSQLGPKAVVKLEGKDLLVEADDEMRKSVSNLLFQAKLGRQPIANLLPKPKSALELVKDGKACTLLDLLDQYVLKTGMPCFATDEDRNHLLREPLGLTGVERIEAADAVAFLETLLDQSGTLISFSESQGRRALRIHGPESRRRGGTLVAMLVPMASLPQYASHPAISITTAVHLPNTDVRLLSNTARQMVSNPSMQMMAPAGSGHSMVLTGGASWVTSMAKLMRELDALSAARMSQSAPAIEIIALEHANPAEVMTIVHNIVAPANGIGFRIDVDKRLNALVVRCNGKHMATVKDLVAKLDVAKR